MSHYLTVISQFIHQNPWTCALLVLICVWEPLTEIINTLAVNHIERVTGKFYIDGKYCDRRSK